MQRNVVSIPQIFYQYFLEHLYAGFNLNNPPKQKSTSISLDQVTARSWSQVTVLQTERCCTWGNKPTIIYLAEGNMLCRVAEASGSSRETLFLIELQTESEKWSGPFELKRLYIRKNTFNWFLRKG